MKPRRQPANSPTPKKPKSSPIVSDSDPVKNQKGSSSSTTTNNPSPLNDSEITTPNQTTDIDLGFSTMKLSDEEILPSNTISAIENGEGANIIMTNSNQALVHMNITNSKKNSIKFSKILKEPQLTKTQLFLTT